MNRFKWIALFAFSFSIVNAQNDNDHEICNLFLDATKSTMTEDILNCTPDKTGFIKLVRSESEMAGLSDVEIDSLLDEFNRRAVENMKRFQKEAQARNIHWDQIKTDSIVTLPRNRSEQPFPRQKVLIWISDKNQQQCIILTDITFIDDRWRLTDKFIFKD